MVVVIYNSGIDFLPGCRFVVRIHLDGTIIVEAGISGSIDIASHLLTAISPGTGFLGDTPLIMHSKLSRVAYPEIHQGIK